MVMDCIVSCAPDRKMMHVQSLSNWAPANIGPYSQLAQASGLGFLAGQIGMVPATLELPRCTNGLPCVHAQTQLSIQHVESIMSTVAKDAFYRQMLVVVCFYANEAARQMAEEAWHDRFMVHVPPTLYVMVPRLPKGACVEWQVVMVNDGSEGELEGKDVV
jgi:diphthine-ammonia ligase